MSIVSDAGPLIAFAKVDQLSLLQKLFGQVLIPPAVEHELFAKVGPEVPRLDAALATSSLRVVRPAAPSAEVHAVIDDLGLGEAEAIALAFEHRATLIADDRAARSRARQVAVPVTGTVGVLIDAKRTGLLPLVVPVLQLMRDNAYWLSDELIDAARRLSGE